MDRRWYFDSEKDKVPRRKRYLEDSEGSRCIDVWTDIPSIQGNEHLGYPTKTTQVIGKNYFCHY